MVRIKKKENVKHLKSIPENKEKIKSTKVGCIQCQGSKSLKSKYLLTDTMKVVIL